VTIKKEYKKEEAMKPIFNDPNWIDINRTPAHGQNPMVINHGRAKGEYTCADCNFLHHVSQFWGDECTLTEGLSRAWKRSYQACSYLKLKEKKN